MRGRTLFERANEPKATFAVGTQQTDVGGVTVDVSLNRLS